MKIAFIGQKGLPAVGGGVERYVEDLATRLAEHGHQTIVYTRPYYTPKQLKQYAGVRLVSLPSIHSKHLDAISHSALSVLHAVFSGADIIHFQSIGSALVAWLPKLLRPSVKIVSTLQSKDYEHGKWGVWAKKFLLWGEKIMCRRSDAVVVVTKLMADYVRERYGVEAIYIPNGAAAVEAVGDELLAEWGLCCRGYIVAISRLIRHKGLSHLVEAYKQLGAIDLPLVIVGEGAFTDDYVAELKKQAADCPRIIFTGPQHGAKLAQLYANAYLFVQPSESEGLSLALLEAMARRTPVLVSDIPENLEAVGNSGLVFKVRDIADLREKLRFALNEATILADKAEAAARRVDICFNWEQISQNMDEVYRRTIDGERLKTVTA